jgi:predicted  nucleic acid-binding Zn-ribbon protein
VKLDGAALGTTIGALGTIGVALLTGLFSWVVRRQSRVLDVANVRKTDAETASQEVRTARELLADVRQYMTERLEAQAAEHREEIAEVSAQVEGLQSQIRDLAQQHRNLRAAYAVHRQWDQAAWARLLQVEPSYPPPPSIEGL